MPLSDGQVLGQRANVIELRNLSAAYGRIEVLHGIDLVLPAGTVLALLGPNGAGKSTTLKVVSGLLVPPGDAHRLAQALALLLQESATRERMARAAHARVSRDFVFEKQVSGTEKLYLDLCGSLTMPSAENAKDLTPDDWPSPAMPEPSTGNDLSAMLAGLSKPYKATRS